MTRTVRGAAAIVALLPPLMLLPASAALALARDDGDDPGSGLSHIETLGIYVGIPVALFAIIALLVYAPSLASGPRYRPGWTWWHDAVWFAGPKGDDMTYAEPAVGVEPGRETMEGGGARARW